MTGESISLQSATVEDFKPLVGETFLLAEQEGGDVVTELQLNEVESTSHQAPGGRKGFSLYFHGSPDIALQQQIYWLTHVSAGTLGIFLVPISGDAERLRYQAVFN